MQKKILYILSGNLSTTPRALKSIRAFHNHPIEIVLVNRLDKWGQKDREIIQQETLNVNSLNLGKKPFLPWLKASLLAKVSQILYRLFPENININAYSSNKSSIILWQHLKKHNYSGYDLIIAHSGGSLYPAYKLSQKWNIPFIFDVEDYHPGEFIRYDAVNEKKRREFLMQQLLPKATALTSASPLIWEYTAPLLSPLRVEDSPSLREAFPLHQVILNSFPQSEFVCPSINQFFNSSDNQVLRLVWFSQKISFGRGLEQLFEALTTLHPSGGDGGGLIITLIGDMDPEFNEQIIQPFLKNYQTNDLPTYPPNDLPSYQTMHLSLIEPLSQPDLHAELAKHDIGLALEFDNADLNRQLCLTNKIIAYAQAGLYILATDTPAQQQFMEEHNGCGTICKQNAAGIKDGLMVIYKGIEELRKSRIMRFEKGKELAWEKESKKLVEMWRGLGY